MAGVRARRFRTRAVCGCGGRGAQGAPAGERDKIWRSPTVLVVGCVVVRDHPKVPEIEQVLSAGAAVQNMFLAAHDLGYGVMWKTGPAAYEPGVKRAVGLAQEDHIVAILHLGTRLG